MRGRISAGAPAVLAFKDVLRVSEQGQLRAPRPRQLRWRRLIRAQVQNPPFRRVWLCQLAKRDALLNVPMMHKHAADSRLHLRPVGPIKKLSDRCVQPRWREKLAAESRTAAKASLAK